jgi:hypothetical protein
MKSKRQLTLQEAISTLLKDESLIEFLQFFTLEEYNGITTTPLLKHETITQMYKINSIKYKNTTVVWDKKKKIDCIGEGKLSVIIGLFTDTISNEKCKCVLTENNLDSCVKQFLYDGYLVIPPNMLHVPDHFHSSVFQKSTENDESLGNNILPAIPQLQQLFDDVTVVDVITRLLGDNYTMQAHRHMHYSKKGTKDQIWHKDSFFGYKKPLRYPQTRNIMAMYYPQNTVLEMGPTAIRRGSQYRTDVPDNHDYSDKNGDTLDLECSAGTIVIIHYDLVHRRMQNNMYDRYMFKFQFSRMMEPSECKFTTLVPEFDQVKLLDTNVSSDITPIARSIWNWMHNIPFTPIPVSENDPNLYELALAGNYTTLINKLSKAQKSDIESSAFALVACTSPDAIRALFSEIPNILEFQFSTICAMYVISEWGSLVRNVLSEQELLNFTKMELSPPDARLYYAEALGTIFCNSKNTTESVTSALHALNSLLQDTDEQVRFTAARSIGKIGIVANNTVSKLKHCLYSDDNRYVHGNIVDTLERIGTPEALAVLLHYLKHQRHCPFTTPDSQF